MKLKYTLGALAVVSSLASCSLDVNMYEGVTGEDVTARNIVELSQGSYSMLKYDGGLIDYGYYFWAYGGDDLSWGGTSTDTKFDIYDYSRNITSSVTEYAWELGYRTIGNCNKVIEMGAELGENLTAEEKVIVGENYYLRALCYFLLVNEFAQPYSNNPTQNPGLPLKLNSDPDDLPQSRSTVAEIYLACLPKTVVMPQRRLPKLCWPGYISIWKIGKGLGKWRTMSLLPAVLNYCVVKNMQFIPSMFPKKIRKPFLPYAVPN